MDFTLSPEVEDLRLRTRAFIEEHVLPLESDSQNFSDHENIPLDRLAPVRAKARAAGLWAPQSPKEFGGMALPMLSTPPDTRNDFTTAPVGLNSRDRCRSQVM